MVHWLPPESYAHRIPLPMHDAAGASHPRRHQFIPRLLAHSHQATGGSLGFVRLVAINTPIPSRTITPTTIQVVGTFSRYAANDSPTMRMRNPIKYVENEDTVQSC